MTSNVCVIIPTWRGGDVIGDAIEAARNQTVEDIDILVSVDRSPDDTLELAERLAAEDSRVRIIAHKERVGWVRNVNAALDMVQSPYFCLYFHDDIIQPSYIETLLARLEPESKAVSAYCNVMRDQGSSQDESLGRDYKGGALTRMLDRLLLEQPGAPLRALTRRHVLDQGLRIPEGSFHGFHAQQAYLLELLAAGESLYEPSVLYRRRTWRPGALTKGWLEQSAETLFGDLVITAQRMKATADRYLDAEPERRFVRCATGLSLGSVWLHTANRIGAPRMSLDPLFIDADPFEQFPDRWAEAALAHLRKIKPAMDQTS
ncbi:MAG: glycosyltransferase family 2 protein [Oceanicaulis sp.]